MAAADSPEFDPVHPLPPKPKRERKKKPAPPPLPDSWPLAEISALSEAWHKRYQSLHETPRVPDLKLPDAWPVAPWTMYSRHTNTIPPPVASEVELRLIDGTGQVHRIVPTDLIPRGRRSVLARAMREAFDPAIPQPLRDGQRQYLATVVSRRFPEQTRMTVEAWEI